jgi:hypothetical protein
MLGISQTRSVQISMSAGKATSVAVSPKRLMTMPVPNSENRNEIEFVVCTKQGAEQWLNNRFLEWSVATNTQVRKCYTTRVRLDGFRTCPK